MNPLYACTIILTDLMMLAMILHVIHYSGFTKTQKLWYILTFVSIFFCATAEFLVHNGYHNPKFNIILTIITVLQFSLSPMLGVFFSGALGLHKEAKIAALIFLVNFLFEVIAAPFGLIFYFNEVDYFRGTYFYIYEIFYIISLLYLIISITVVGRRFRHRDFWTIIMILVVLIAGILPMTIWQTHIAYMAIAISASLCYIYYNDLVQQDIKADLVANQEKISLMQEHIISGMANLIENRDMETGEHILRTSNHTKLLAQKLRKENIYADILTDEFINNLYILSPMHDIGKIVVSDRILKKPGKLTAEEYEIMKDHARVGGKVVREVLAGIAEESYIAFASDIATYHHERWDGTGYPVGLKEEAIPLSARIMAVADVFDALISKRCYKEPIPVDEAIEIIKSESGTHFDPKLVEVFIKFKDEFINNHFK